MSEEPFNPGNPESVQKRQTRADVARKAADMALGSVMGTAEGRKVLWSILVRSHLFHISHLPGGSHADCAFAEGQRNVGLPLLTDINRVCPDLYPVMARENLEAS